MHVGAKDIVCTMLVSRTSFADVLTRECGSGLGAGAAVEGQQRFPYPLDDACRHAQATTCCNCRIYCIDLWRAQ
jgi:hypothetical protein